MTKKESAKAKRDMQLRKKKAAALVRSLKKTEQKLELDLKKLKEGLSSPVLYYHRL